MSRCYPFTHPRYKKKNCHKNKDKKKNRKIDEDLNIEFTYEKNLNEWPQVVLSDSFLKPKYEKQSTHLIVRLTRVQKVAIPQHLHTTPSTLACIKHGKKDTIKHCCKLSIIDKTLILHKQQSPLSNKQKSRGVDTSKLAIVLTTERNSRSNTSNHIDDDSHQRQFTSNVVVTPNSSEVMLELKLPGAWSNLRDEDWLFAKKSLKSNVEVERGKTTSLEFPMHVWAEAMISTCGKLYALPYVVLY